jgi:hypothetical protein
MWEFVHDAVNTERKQLEETQLWMNAESAAM